MTDLIENLNEYKLITKEILSALENDDTEILEAFFKKREEIIKVMSKLNYNPKEFSLCCDELRIMDLEKIVSSLIKEKMDLTQFEIKKVKLAKSANNDYNKDFYNSIKLFDKQV